MQKPGYLADKSGTEVQEQEPVTKLGDWLLSRLGIRDQGGAELSTSGDSRGRKPDRRIRVIIAHASLPGSNGIVVGLVLGFNLFKKNSLR